MEEVHYQEKHRKHQQQVNGSTYEMQARPDDYPNGKEQGTKNQEYVSHSAPIRDAGRCSTRVARVAPSPSDIIGSSGSRRARHCSSGHVWQGRYYSCPLDDAHLWAALRYAELNPVRAGMADHPCGS